MFEKAFTALLGFAMAALLGSEVLSASSRRTPNIFAKDNLVAWCIVPFDSKHRDSLQRAQMLKSLGITKEAYDWREKNIPTFSTEIETLQRYQIKLQAFWLTSGPDPARDRDVATVFNVLKRHHVKTQIWYLFIPGDGFASLSQEEKLEEATKAVRYIANKAEKIGCEVGLYNHNGWFGEPENQLAILARLQMPNVGMVYNFNHAQHQMKRFVQFFPKILPHLIAINLAGLDGVDHKVVPLGTGDSALNMIRLIYHSDYDGPIGIINENTAPDAEVGLRENMEGLKKILQIIGDTAALGTY